MTINNIGYIVYRVRSLPQIILSVLFILHNLGDHQRVNKVWEIQTLENVGNNPILPNNSPRSEMT